MFSKFKNKEVSRIYRIFYKMEILEYINNKYNIGLTQIGLTRFINKAKNRELIFDKKNQSTELAYYLVKELIESIYEDTPVITRDESFVLIRRNFKNTKWYVTSTYEKKHIDLMRIKDQSFIDLLRKMDKSGKFEEYCDGIRYLDDDIYYKQFKQQYDKGTERNRNNTYWQKSSNLKRARMKWRRTHAKIDLDKVKILEKEINKLYSRDMMDTDFRRFNYIRVGGFYLIGVNGSKDQAKEFGTPIHHDKFVPWMDTLLTSKSSKVTKRMSDGRRGRYTHGSIRFYVTEGQLIKDLKDLGYNKGFTPITKTDFIHQKPSNIVHHTNRINKKLYDKYRRCTNVSLLQSVSYVLEYAMYYTLGRKYKLSVAKIKTKYSKNKKFIVDGATFRKLSFKVVKSL